MGIKAYVSKVEMNQDEWLKFRANGLGSSDAGAILGVNEYKTPLDVYLEKTGQAPQKESTLRMQFGLDVEPIIAGMFEQRTGLKTVNDFKIRTHPQYPFLIANLDRVIQGGERGTGILEIKTAGKAVQAKWESQDIPISQSYFIQIQHQMLVTGYQYGYFAILIFGYSGVEDFHILEVQRDEKFIENILFPILFDFWNNHIIPRVPPEPKTINDVQILYPSPVEGKTLVATPEMVDKILRLKEVREALKPLEDEKKQIEDELKFEIADAEAIVLGSETLATYKKSKDSLKFDTKRFEAENPELAQKYSVLVPGPRRLLIK